MAEKKYEVTLRLTVTVEVQAENKLGAQVAAVKDAENALGTLSDAVLVHSAKVAESK